MYLLMYFKPPQKIVSVLELSRTGDFKSGISDFTPNIVSLAQNGKKSGMTEI